MATATRTAEAEALEATAAAFRGSGEKACCHVLPIAEPGYLAYTWLLPCYIWLPKAYGNMMQHVLHHVPHDVDNPLWYLFI